MLVALMKPASRRLTGRGLTLIELMVVISLLGILVAMVGPSFKQFIDVQRIRSVNAALITDLQFARAEAGSRNQMVGVFFDSRGANATCYVIFMGAGTADSCDCYRPPGQACVGPNATEIRTVQVPRDSSIVIEAPPLNPDPTSANPNSDSIYFEPSTGRLVTFYDDGFQSPPPLYPITVNNPSVGGFINNLASTGRPSVCSPSGRIRGVTPCL